MSKVVKEPKKHYTIRLKPSFKRKIKETAEKHHTTEIDIFTQGADLYMKYLEGDLEVNNK